MTVESRQWLKYFSPTQSRRPAVLKQLLENHLTTSALFWGKAYDLLEYIALPISTANFEAELALLCEQGFLQKTAQGMLLTKKGTKIVQVDLMNHAQFGMPAFFHGFDWKNWEKMFLLMVQVASELSYQNSNYFVIANDLRTQYRFKEWLKKYGKERLLSEVQTSLAEFLSQEDPKLANLFCEQLTGHNQLGKTRNQLATIYDYSLTDLEVLWLDMCSRYAQFLLTKGQALSELVHFYKRNSLLSESNQKTYELFLAQKKLTEIAKIRGLKLGTIQEHLLNAALLLADFPFAQVLSSKLTSELKSFYGETPILEWDFKTLQATLPDISFFEYRLYQIERIIQDGVRT